MEGKSDGERIQAAENQRIKQPLKPGAALASKHTHTHIKKE